MDRWDYYYNIASQEYEWNLMAPYDYDESVDYELIESYKIKKGRLNKNGNR